MSEMLLQLVYDTAVHKMHVLRFFYYHHLVHFFCTDSMAPDQRMSFYFNFGTQPYLTLLA